MRAYTGSEAANRENGHMSEAEHYPYPRNGASGRCPDCDRPVHYVSGSNSYADGTWFHDERHDENTCWPGKARFEREHPSERQ